MHPPVDVLQFQRRLPLSNAFELGLPEDSGAEEASVFYCIESYRKIKSVLAVSASDMLDL